MKHIIEFIEEVVCYEEKINPECLHTKSMKREWCGPRQIIMSLAYEYGLGDGLTYSSVSRYFDRDHATVIHARKSVQNDYDTDKLFRAKIDKYRNILTSILKSEKREELMDVYSRNIKSLPTEEDKRSLLIKMIEPLEKELQSLNFQYNDVKNRLYILKDVIQKTAV